jgi:hypothetical protein
LGRFGHRRDGDDRAVEAQSEEIASEVDLLLDVDFAGAAFSDQGASVRPEEFAGLGVAEVRESIFEREFAALLFHGVHGPLGLRYFRVVAGSRLPDVAIVYSGCWRMQPAMGQAELMRERWRADPRTRSVFHNAVDCSKSLWRKRQRAVEPLSKVERTVAP